MKTATGRRFMGLAFSVALLAPLLSATSSASNETESTLVVHVKAASGERLSARVRLAPARWAERVRLQLWRDPQRVTHAGSLRVSVPPGDYNVFVSRGNEWSLSEFQVQLSPGATVSRSVTLEHQVSLPGWHAADLHVHTERSNDAHAHGGVRVEGLLAEGITLAVGTDHNQIGDLGQGMESLAGAEITTWNPEVGHFNAFPLRRMPQWSGTNPARLIDELAQDSAVFVQVNHPALDDHIAYFKLGGFDGKGFARDDFHLNVHGLEVWNGYDIARLDHVDALLTQWRAWVARGHRLTATGGSDCHGAPGHHPGYPRTYVPTDSASKLAPALKAGQAFVSNGPLLSLRVNGHEAGASVQLTQRTQRTVEATITVLAPDWMQVERAEIWAGETRVWTQLLSRAPQVSDEHAKPLRFEANVVIEVGSAQTLHAVARGGAGLDRLLGRGGVTPLAFTNPIYLERALSHTVVPNHGDRRGE